MADPINSPATLGGDRSTAELEAEIARRDEEILRLRDLLIARDAELGAARGRLRIIDDQAERMARLVESIPIPGVRWIVDGLLRLLQARGG